MKFPDGLGLCLVRWVTDYIPNARTVVNSWFVGVPSAVAAARLGADEVVRKPTGDEFLASILVYVSGSIPLYCAIENPDRVQQTHIKEVVWRSRSNVSLADRYLHLHRRSLRRMLKRFEEQSRLR